MLPRTPRTLARAIRAAKDERDIEPLAIMSISQMTIADGPEMFAHILARLDRIERALGIGVKRG